MHHALQMRFSIHISLVCHQKEMHVFNAEQYFLDLALTVARGPLSLSGAYMQ